MVHYILFFIFAALAVAGALNLLAQRHPIASALSLIVVMGSLAGEYLLLGAEFVAAIQVIVYAGAIMVLFVFVIMLLNAGIEVHHGRSWMAKLLGFPAFLAILGLLCFFVQRGFPNVGSVRFGDWEGGGAQQVGYALFTEYLLPFEVTSVLILIAIIGAIVLARKELD